MNDIVMTQGSEETRGVRGVENAPVDFSDLAAPQRRALDMVREVAIEKGCRPYLVGGPVRDLLLGRHVIDIDVSLEEGSSTLARALARRLEGRVRSHPQFLTYKVTAPDHPQIDIATARKEKYRAPGALPTVMAGRLHDDLLRRDFSVNAMAVGIIDGRLHDPTGGQRDLDARQLRVLHEASFLDDPTRVFRAIRFATRLDFAVEPQTDAWMREAIAGSALTTVSRERLWRELFLAMDESQPDETLARLEEIGALDALFGMRRIDSRLLTHAQEAVMANPALDRYVAFTAALLGPDATVAQLEGSGFSQKRARKTLQIARDFPRLDQALADSKSERHRFRIYRTVPPEMLAMLVLRNPDEEARVARFTDFQKFKIALRGNELDVPQGAHIAKALERAREAVWNGEIPAEDARSFARRLAMEYLEKESEGRGRK